MDPLRSLAAQPRLDLVVRRTDDMADTSRRAKLLFERKGLCVFDSVLQDKPTLNSCYDAALDWSCCFRWSAVVSKAAHFGMQSRS